ncbi:MAG TPA: hypothetical protein VFA65_13970 [Bryobacteraceae bacterium]|nr:hypothetical protein [Bryobacteraceae bacterium]
MKEFDIAGDTFRLGYRFQRHWDVSMASAFFCGELGAGLYLASLAFNSVWGLAVGLAIVGIGKSFFHLTHMGVPRKSWRAIIRPDRSWVSRGLIAIIGFCGTGILYTADLAMGRMLPPTTSLLLLAVSAVCAAVIMVYQGLAMASSSAISLWTIGMMPFIGVIYGLTSGVIIMLARADYLDLETARILYETAVVALIVDLLTIAATLNSAFHSSSGGRVSVEQLTKYRYAKWFYGITIGLGILVPLLALAVGGRNFYADLVAIGGVLTGFYSLRVLVLKVGVYEPLLPLQFV